MSNKEPTRSAPAKPTASTSTRRRNILRGGLAVMALTVALSYDFVKNMVIDTGLLLGPVVPINTEGCEVVRGLEACEDIHIHRPSGLAFMTCGNAEMRKIWYPPIERRNVSAPDQAFQDRFVIYDIASGTYDVKDLVGLPAEFDRVFHGIDFYERSSTELTIFAINHRRTGSVVEVLEYKLGDKFVYHKETIKHDLIQTPNDIVALGPRSFYISNDHRYLSGAMRQIEKNLRRPWSNVIYYSPENAFVAFDHVASANGITANQDRSLVFLSACYGGAVHVLKPVSALDAHLVELDHVKLDFYTDNPSFDPTTGNVLITGHVKPLIMVAGLHTLGVPFNGPSKVVKMSLNPLAKTSSGAPKYQLETVVQDDGHLISTGTVAALDRERGVMLIGTAFSDRGLVRCPIPKNA